MEKMFTLQYQPNNQLELFFQPMQTLVWEQEQLQQWREEEATSNFLGGVHKIHGLLRQQDRHQNFPLEPSIRGIWSRYSNKEWMPE
jgi:hypothetical protein